jgi:asparagine N-glycosylation enzyme membrane subunit Stt3
MRRTFLWINFVLSTLIVLLVFAQAYFITAYVTGAGEDALDTHGFIGFAIIHPAELLVFLTSFGAWPRAWKWIGFTFFLFVLGTVQIFLAPPDEDPASGWVHGFHGLLALVVAVTAALIAHRGMRDLGLRRASRGGGREDAAPPQPLP